MLILKDRVKQIASAPVPTGTLTLGTTPNSYRSFSSVLSSGDETYYAIETSNSFEVGIGRYGIEGSNTLTRDTVLSSSTGSKLSLTGRATVFITVPAAKFPFVDPSGELNLSLNTLSDVSLTTPASGESLKYNGSSWVNGIAAGYTTEEAQDAVGSILADTSSISFSYNDGTPSISASVKNSGVTNDMLATGIDTTKIGSGSVSSIEFGYLDGVTSSLQGQLDSKYDSTNPSGYLTESGASGIYVPLTRTINTLALSANQTFAAGTSGTDFAIASSGTTHTFSIPDAGASARGLVTTGTQTIAGTKTLVGDLLFTDATYDLGKSGATRPRDAFFSRNVTVGSLLTTSKINMPDNSNVNAGGITGGSSYGLYFANNGTSLHYAHNGASIFSFGSFAPHYGGTPTTAVGFGFGATSTAGDIFLQRDAAGILHQRNATNAQTLRLAETWTSSTSFGAFQIKANAGAAYQIGSAKGSAGGNNQAIEIGHYDAAGAFTARIHVTTAGKVGVNHNNASYLRDVFQVNTASTSTSFGSGNIADQGITITNSTNTVNRPIGLQFSGYEGWGFGGIYGTMTSSGGNTYGRISIALRSNYTGYYAEVCRWDENACMLVSPWISTSGSPTAFTITGAAHTTLTASTEATDVNLNLARTVQFATGALTTQRAMRIQAPTYGFVGASTITTASTLSISGAPVAGTFATITNAYALNVESGKSYFSDDIVFASGKVAGGSGNGFGVGTAGAGIPSVKYFSTYQFEFGSGIFCAASALGIGPTLSGYAATGADTLWYRDGAGIFAQRNGTNAQTLRVYNTYTSSTSYETLNIKGKASANFEIGPENGSAGGTLRGLTIGCYPAGTATIVGWAQFRPNASTGALEAFYLGPIADSTAVGGNARGTNAVDLQIVRTGATQVAAGARSFLAGARNIASGGDSYVIGNDCTGSGQYSIAIGTFNQGTNYAAVAFGINGLASGNQSLSLSMGNGGTASALKAFICGEGVSSATNSWATGFGVLADRQGMAAYSQGSFAANGDAQKVWWVLRRKTTDATPITLMVDGSSTRLTIPSGKKLTAFIIVSGVKSDGSACAEYMRKVSIKNVGGTTSLIGSVEAIGTDIEDNVLTDVAITADNTNDALDISVTGISGETWRWVAVIEGLEIAYGV